MDKKNARILFLGTPQISADVLDMLIKNGYNIIGVISQPDKPIGRKMIIEPTPTKIVAQRNKIEVFQPVKIRNDFEFVKSLKPDVLLTLAYGQIIPHDMLEIPSLSLNLHGSLLPKYRGASPIQEALFNGDKTTGVTLMQMVDVMDAGKMYGSIEIAIDDKDNYTTLSKKLTKVAFDCFDTYIQDVIDKKNLGIEQDLKLVSFTKKIKKEDELLNFINPAIQLNNQIRALNDEPGAYFIYKELKIKVSEATYTNEDEQFVCGKIYDYTKNSLSIGTSKGLLHIQKLQKPGKRMMPISDFFNGNKDFFAISDIIK